MSKVVDITDKLELTNPVLKIKDKVFPIHSDAKTVMQLAAINETGNDQEKIAKSIELLFGKEKSEELLSMPLTFSDLLIIIKVSMRLATGKDIDVDEDNEDGSKS